MNEMKMKNKKLGTSLIAILAVLLVLISITPVAIATGKLWLDTIPSGSYVDDSEDAWLIESTVTANTSCNLEIYYHQGKNIHHLYLLVAVERDPAGNVVVKVNNNPVGPYDGVITSNNNALVSETNPEYEFPGHGIYKYGSDVHFEVVDITNLIPGDGILQAGETITVPVEILPNSPIKVHFDAVGGDSGYEAIAFNPPSHDVTYHVPEFSTIAIPVASILGLLFFFNHRKRKND